MTPDQKRDAWARFAAGAPVEFYATVAGYRERSPAQNAAIHADELLSEVEQREREGRFGTAADDVGCDAQDRNGCQFEADRQHEWMERAQRTEGLLVTMNAEAVDRNDALAKAVERMEHIAQALGVVVDRIDADQYDTKAAIARDIIAALRPPSKPETP